MLRLPLLVAFLSILLPEPLSALQVSLPFLGGTLGLNGPIVLVTFLKIKPLKGAPFLDAGNLIAIGHDIGAGLSGAKSASSGGNAVREASGLAKSLANPALKASHTPDLFAPVTKGSELGKLSRSKSLPNLGSKTKPEGTLSGLGKSASQRENSLSAGKLSGTEDPKSFKPPSETGSLRPKEVPHPNETPHIPAEGEEVAVTSKIKPLSDYPFYTRVKEWYRQATTNKMLVHLSKYGNEEVKEWAKDNMYVKEALKREDEETVVGHYLSKVVAPNWRQTWERPANGELLNSEKISKGWKDLFGNQRWLRRGIEMAVSAPFIPLIYLVRGLSLGVSKLRVGYNLRFIKWLRVNASKNIAETIPHFPFEDKVKLADASKVHPIDTHPEEVAHTPTHGSETADQPTVNP